MDWMVSTKIGQTVEIVVLLLKRRIIGFLRVELTSHFCFILLVWKWQTTVGDSNNNGFSKMAQVKNNAWDCYCVRFKTIRLYTTYFMKHLCGRNDGIKSKKMTFWLKNRKQMLDPRFFRWLPLQHNSLVRLLPTYRIEPKTPFHTEKCESILKSVLESAFDEFEYSAEAADDMVLQLSQTIMSQIKKLNFDR